jgi:DNA (cytosine-5)-methyltransferase 1
MGYHHAGFRVVGVDIKAQPHYPFEFIRADAIEYLSELISVGPAHLQFAAIHASPPCQFASKAKVIWDNLHPDLLEPTRELLECSGLPYVIENVKGARLREPVVLEGQMFGLNTHRPRLFETNWPLEVPVLRLMPGPMAKMGRPLRPGESVQVVGHFSDVTAAREAMGIDWMSRDELSEAIPPAYTEFIGRQLMVHASNVFMCRIDESAGLRTRGTE